MSSFLSSLQNQLLFYYRWDMQPPLRSGVSHHFHQVLLNQLTIKLPSVKLAFKYNVLPVKVNVEPPEALNNALYQGRVWTLEVK